MARSKTPLILENVEVLGMAAEGKCVAKPDGKVLFLKDTAPGDVVDVRVTRKKKSFLEGYPIKFHERSKVRVTPVCGHFDICGGCKWQHINYAEQLAYKQQQVVDALERIGKVEINGISPIIASSQTEYYRNKLEFTFSNSRWFTTEEIESGDSLDGNALGFHIPGRFDKVLQIEHCHLQPEPSNKIRNWLDQYARANGLSFYDLYKHEGFLRIMMIRTTTTGEVMVLIQFAEDEKSTIETLLGSLVSEFPELTSVNYVINTKKNDTINDLEVINYSGREHIIEKMGDLQFIIGPKSFYQTNPIQAERLYQVALEYADLQGDELVYDLYTGTGTIANYVARKAAKVVGVEYVPEAIVDADKNSQLNNISNTEFFAGDMKDLLNESFIAENGQPDVIITDPPRAGMHPDVVDTLLKIAAKKIVYVSCNPATQARDLELLADQYAVTRVQPVDMFPHTHHVECVCLLELK
ncbi:MAG: 23S rRNA (uracil(1939)-C(5))-methyltransferase RlmD [Cyclobacteriaceae bacterium]